MIRTQGAVLALAMGALLGGCATHYQETADREQRASIDLQRAGARDASRAAQGRSDAARAASRCDGFLDCLLTGLLTGEASSRR